MTPLKNVNWQMEMRTISDSAKLLFNNKTMSDVIFVFKIKNKKPKIIYAHSWLLSIMSVTFYNTFENNFEVNKEIVIVDKPHEIYLELLNFLYTSKCNLTVNNAFDIMEIAKKYSLKFLIEDCTNFIAKNFTDKTSCEILSKAITIENNELKNDVIKYIGSRIRSVLKTDGFIKIDKEALQLILNINETGPITEREIFSAVMKWATNKCNAEKMNINGINKRVILGDLIKLIRFQCMSVEEYGECVNNEDGLLTVEENLSLLLSFTTKKKNNKGFVDNKRTHKLYLKNINDDALMIYDVYQIWTRLPYPSISNKSKFTINKCIYLTQLFITLADIEQTVNIKLLDNKNTKIYENKFQIEQMNETIGKCLILTEPVLLNTNIEYILDINYEKMDCNFFIVDSLTMPIIKKQDEVEFKFTKLNQLLMGIFFKPFY